MPKTLQTAKKNKDWYRIKRYPHIGLPLTLKNRGWVDSYVKDKKAIESHSFLPFIHKVSKVRKFRKEVCHDGTRSKLRKPGQKIRELYYSSHLDATIYSYYTELLSKAYEAKLKCNRISDNVTGYRRIKLDAQNPLSRNKCNIDFANDIFGYIKNCNEDHLVVVAFDIKSFFDNLNHKKLKEQWREVIGSGIDLPPDHYNIYRNITKFSYVEERDIFNEFKGQIVVERNLPGLTKMKIKRRKFLRNKKASAFCMEQDVGKLRSKNFIKSNKYHTNEVGDYELRKKGIPQGSPISAVLANIYMLEFDQDAKVYLTNRKGIYRRYSDDMIAICRPEHEAEIINFFTKEVINYELEIQEAKTQVFHFIRNNQTNKFECKEKNLHTNKFQTNTKFEYLGFQFDGYYTLLKNSSLAAFYRKMKRSIKRGFFYSSHNNTQTKGKLFKNRLYKRFTHLGAQRRRIYERDKSDPSKFNLTHKFDWGNYLSYAKLAASIIPDNKIKTQIKKHWKIFHDLIG